MLISRLPDAVAGHHAGQFPRSHADYGESGRIPGFYRLGRVSRFENDKMDDGPGGRVTGPLRGAEAIWNCSDIVHDSIGVVYSDGLDLGTLPGVVL